MGSSLIQSSVQKLEKMGILVCIEMELLLLVHILTLMKLLGLTQGQNLKMQSFLFKEHPLVMSFKAL